MSGNKEETLPFSKKRWPKIVAVIVLLITGFLVALPHAIRYSLERWLVNNGAQSAEIKKVKLNLFTGTFGVSDLNIKLNDNVVLGDDDIRLNFALSSLLKKEGYLQTGTLSGLVLDIELEKNGTLRIGSISTPPSPASPPEPEKLVEETAAGWLFRAGYMELKDCLVRFTMPKLEKTIQVDHAVLNNFTTGSAAQPAYLELQGRINETPLSLELDKIELSPAIAATGHIRVDGYRMEYLQELLEDALDSFAGSVSLGGKVQFSMGEKGDITAQYNGAIEVADTDIGSSDFSIKSPSISYKGAVSYEQDADFNMVIDVEGLLQGSDAAVGIPVTDLDLLEKQLQIDGKSRVSISKDSNVTVATDADLALGEFSLNLPPLNVANSALNWQGHVEYTLLDGPGSQTVAVAGKAVLQQPSYKMRSADFTMHTGAKELSWQGEAGYLLAGDTSTISLDGTLKGMGLESLLDEQKIKIGQQELSVNANKLSLEIGKQIKFGGKASLAANTLQVDSDGSPLVQLEKTAVSELSGTAEGGLQIDVLTLSGLGVPATEARPLTLTVPEISIKQITSTDFTGATVAELEISEPTVLDTKNKTLLAAIDSVSGRNIKADASARVSLDSLSTGKGTFLKKEGKKTKPQATLVKLNIDKVSWSNDDGLFVDTIALDSLFARYDKAKSPAAKGNETKQGKKKEKKKEKAEPAETAMIPIRINSIALTGNSALRFTDQTLTTPFLATLALQTVELKDIDSQKPDSPMSYTIKGEIDKYAPLEITGTAAPFAKDLTVDSKISLRNYSMQMLSPYVTDAIGTKFNKGQMNITSDLKIKEGNLDLQNHLLFQDIEAETVREELLEKLNNELPVSLDTALSMLRDKNGDIELNVPVTGPLNDISVSVTDIVVTALSKAIGVAVTPYLAYTALGPAGALVYVGMKAGQAMFDTSLPTLEFENRETELTDVHKKDLKKVGKIMKKNKDRDYSICSKVLLWELSPDVERNFENQQKILKDKEARKKLLVIGGKRAENVQQYLLDKYPLDKKHLLVCSPNVDLEPDGKPRVGFRD